MTLLPGCQALTFINVMQFRAELYLIEYFGVKVVPGTQSQNSLANTQIPTCHFYENSWSFAELRSFISNS